MLLMRFAERTLGDVAHAAQAPFDLLTVLAQHNARERIRACLSRSATGRQRRLRYGPFKLMLIEGL